MGVREKELETKIPRFRRVFVTECFSGSNKVSSEYTEPRCLQGLTSKSTLQLYYVGINGMKLSTVKVENH